MAFRLPRYSFLHALRAAGSSALTVSVAEVTGFPKVRLLDGMHQPLAKFVSGAGVTFTLDRGAAGLEVIDRLILPAGHNLAGATTIAVTSDDNSGFTTPTTMLAAVAVAAGQIDKNLTGSTERYVRLTVAGTGAWELPELWFTRYRVFTDTQNALDPKWADQYVPSLVRANFPSGVTATLELGDPKRAFEFTHRKLSGADLAIYDELAAAIRYGRDAFWIDPPDDTELPVCMECAAVPTRTQDHPIPVSGTTYTYDVSWIQSLA